MPIDEPRHRPFPSAALTTAEAAIAFLDFVRLTAVNKLAGLDEAQARATPLPTSPVVSLLGLMKHLTAVQRQHIQRHIGDADLPVLWDADDHDHEFRLGEGETIDSVVAAFDAEWALSRATLAKADLDATITAYGAPVRAGRLLVDVLQESARHLGHMDVVREMIDGAKGE